MNEASSLARKAIAAAISSGVPSRPIGTRPSNAERAATGRSLSWVRRYGAFALLLAWLPIAGDALCLAAGAVRVRWTAALAAIAAGKLARYLVVAQAAHLF